jgi:hypothetical protein
MCQLVEFDPDLPRLPGDNYDERCASTRMSG